MIAHQHIIRKVSIDLQLNNQEDVEQTQKEYLAVFQEKVMPELEKFLDEQSGADELIELKQINIDLGDLSKNSSTDDLAKRWLTQLKKSISLELASRSTSKEQNKAFLYEIKLDVFIHFLQKGCLPYTAPANIDFQKEFVLLLNERAKETIFRIGKAVDTTGLGVLERLVAQLNEQQLELLLQAVCEQQENQWLLALKKQIQQVLKSKTRIVVKRIWNYLIYFAFFANKRKIARDFLFFIEDAGSLTEKELAQILRLLEENTLGITETIEKDEAKTTQSSEEAPNLLFVKNAGIILLHPFLSYFFLELDLIKSEGNSKDEISREKAVGLLHYLATGQTAAQEFDLSFCKIMCNMPLAHPIASEFDISEGEKLESEKLLKAVIKNWDALGNVSIDALREGFLQREGKVEITEDSIQIQMERKTIDLLLDKIPWNISIVKIPWILRKILVSWR